MTLLPILQLVVAGWAVVCVSVCLFMRLLWSCRGIKAVLCRDDRLLNESNRKARWWGIALVVTVGALLPFFYLLGGC